MARKRTPLVLAMIGVVAVGCASRGADTAEQRTSSRTEAVPAWSAPRTGVPVPAAEVPDLGATGDRETDDWLDAGRTCRAYDGSHGTTSRLLAFPSADRPSGVKVAADTPCLDTGGAWVVAR